MTRRKRQPVVRERSAIEGTGPVRTCVGCGLRDRQSRLIRFGLAPSGHLQVIAGGLSGRGAYVHFGEHCIGAMKSTKLLRRSLRAEVDAERRAAIIADLAGIGTDATAVQNG